jgi:hypothetical protein
MKPTGKEEVREAVVIAILSALATALVNWGVDTARDAMKRRKDEEATEVAERAQENGSSEETH